MADLTPLYADLDFNSPLSDAHAERLVASLGPLDDALVVDLGCGWAELLQRVLLTEPTSRGIGVDTDEDALAHGRERAASRGLAERIELRSADAAQWSDELADVLLCVGSSHCWADLATALAALRGLLRPGGRLLLGAEFWMGEPTEQALKALDSTPGEIPYLADLVDLTGEHGYRPVALSQASLDEWDAFESRYPLAWERWLLNNPDSPDAAAIRARADEHRGGYLRGYRNVLGFAYLTLGVSR